LEPELSIYDTIPPVVEGLQIEISTEFGWRRYFQDTTPQHKTEGVGEVTRWLHDIAQHKPSHYPLLKEVIIWKQEYRCIQPFCHRLDELHSYAKLVSAFKEADIELSG
jgi:hypothetical protein